MDTSRRKLRYTKRPLFQEKKNTKWRRATFLFISFRLSRVREEDVWKGAYFYAKKMPATSLTRCAYKTA